ncbi:zf-HC2 domain-containing protein [Streptomyces sp. NPDC051940]|uniref:zf-HC2 domain-containing protein n=1 Tax=Streptomyces sp. NPDC051940 TaxID=3155675 RepID=UPI00341550E1
MSMGPYDHALLQSLLGAWALAACAPEETAAVEAHLTDCGACADEALRLRGAVTMLHPQEGLDLDPGLRARVLDFSRERRRPQLPVPGWAAAYDAETARLDALLEDMDESEWGAPVMLSWYDGERTARRETSVAGVIGHLLAVDGLAALALGLPDPLRTGAEAPPPGTPVASPEERTETFWEEAGSSHAEQQRLSRELRRSHAGTVRGVWRDQNYRLIRTASFGARSVADVPVPYGPGISLPIRDAFVDRAFETWIHAADIADAVAYPYGDPEPRHLHRLIELAARMLPRSLAERRRAGLAGPPAELLEAGEEGRSLHLEIEGEGGGDWFIPLDSPAAAASQKGKVAHVVLEGVEFCKIAAGHLAPEEAAAGSDGDARAVGEVLYAAAALSRL